MYWQDRHHLPTERSESHYPDPAQKVLYGEVFLPTMRNWWATEMFAEEGAVDPCYAYGPYEISRSAGQCEGGTLVRTPFQILQNDDKKKDQGPLRTAVPEWVTVPFSYRAWDGTKRIEVAQLEGSEFVMVAGIPLDYTVQQLLEELTDPGCDPNS